MSRRKSSQKKSRNKAKNSSQQAPTIKEVSIESLAHDGRGVGRDDQGKVAFVDGALPGEVVRYSVLETKKKFSKGNVVEVLTESEHRVEPKCKVFGKCGGCVLQHLSESQQIVYKQQQLIDNLQRIGEVSPEEVLAPITSEAWGYRRRARFGATFAQTKKEVRLGFRSRNTHFIQPTKSCDIVDEKISSLLPKLWEVLSELRCNESIQGVELCVAEQLVSVLVLYDGLMLGNDSRHLVSFAEEHGCHISVKNPSEDEQSLYPKSKQLLSFTLKGLGSIDAEDGNADIKLEFLPKDFTQVNSEVNQLLVSQALELLDISESDRVLDLFCGIGNFTLPLASRAKYVVGVEGSDDLVDRADHNQALNKLENIDFQVNDLFSEELFETDAPWLDQQFDKIVLDPPRAGAAFIVQNIDRFEASKIVYISCDPATLARDAKVLVNDHGYTLKHAGVADMFPQTAHVESIAVFER